MKSNTVTKTLYLVRHTNAEAATEAINDIDRPISEKGQKKAQKVCRKLKSKISEASPHSSVALPKEPLKQPKFSMLILATQPLQSKP